MADETRGGDQQLYDWEREPDLTDLSEEELEKSLKALAKAERDVSYRRRVLQGRIDLSPEELAGVLMGVASPVFRGPSWRDRRGRGS